MKKKLSNFLLIKNGEQHQVLYFATLFFFIGAGMAIGRGASETLFFKRYGIEYLPMMYIITSVTLSIISLSYAAYVDRIASEKFYKILFVLLSGLLLLNWAGSRYLETEYAYPAFFLLYEVASELLLIHCAVYLMQNLVQTQSKRLTPLILSGFQVGIITGGMLLALLTPYVGVENMMLIWVFLLISSFILLKTWHQKNGVSPYFRAGKKSRGGIRQSVLQIRQGLMLMQSSKLLQMSSLSLFFLVISVYILAYAVNTVYTQHFDSEESLSRFFGLLTAATGILALLIQLLLTNRFIRDFGIKKVNYIFPVSSIFSYSALLIGFALPSAILGSLNKETLMPAFAKPVRNILNAALPANIQGRAQAVAVIAVIPLGLACAGIFLMLADAQHNITTFLSIGLAGSIALLIFNRGMNLAYAQEIFSNLKNRLFIPDEQKDKLFEEHKDSWNAEILDDIKQGLMDPDDDISLVFAETLSRSAPDTALQLLSERMPDASTAYKDRLIKILQSIDTVDLARSSENNLISKLLGSGDRHLDATLLTAVYKTGNSREKNRFRHLLDEDNPRLIATGIYGVLHFAEDQLIELAISRWGELLRSEKISHYIPAVELLMPSFKNYYLNEPLSVLVRQKLNTMLRHDETRIKLIALETLAHWSSHRSGNPELSDISESIRVLASDEDWKVRNGCLKTVHLLPGDAADLLLSAAVSDRHPAVRNSAVWILAQRQQDDIAFLQEMLTGKSCNTPKAQHAMIEYLLEEGGDPATMQKISLSLANDAVDLYHARNQLAIFDQSDCTASTVLLYALDERIIDTAELALFATQASGSDSEIAVIRAGLRSDDRRQFSNACELLSMMNDKELVALILPIFDDGCTYDKIRHDFQQFDNLESILHWIQSGTDAWLKECSSCLIETLAMKSHV